MPSRRPRASTAADDAHQLGRRAHRSPLAAPRSRERDRLGRAMPRSLARGSPGASARSAQTQIAATTSANTTSWKAGTTIRGVGRDPEQHRQRPDQAEARPQHGERHEQQRDRVLPDDGREGEHREHAEQEGRRDRQLRPRRATMHSAPARQSAERLGRPGGRARPGSERAREGNCRVAAGALDLGQQREQVRIAREPAEADHGPADERRARLQRPR